MGSPPVNLVSGKGLIPSIYANKECISKRQVNWYSSTLHQFNLYISLISKSVQVLVRKAFGSLTSFTDVCLFHSLNLVLCPILISQTVETKLVLFLFLPRPGGKREQEAKTF